LIEATQAAHLTGQPNCHQAAIVIVAAEDGVVPLEPGFIVQVKFFGRHKSGALRDGVLLSVEEAPRPSLTSRWSCDRDFVTVAMEAEPELISVPSLRPPSVKG